jgi:D-alanyl-D-alanine carboxypeptidase
MRRGGLPVAILATLAALATLAGPAAAIERPGYDRAALQRDLDAIHAAGVTGVQGSVRRGYERLTARSGVADLRTGRPVPRGGYFRMGSNTKTLVATLVLQLVAEGRLALDDTVERWLPGVVAGNGNDGRSVTVRHLLQHTSGLYNYTNDLNELASPEGYESVRFRSWRPAELVAIAMRHPPNFAPGTHWDYSNTGYILVGMIIKAVTGRTWDVEVRDRVLRPLGLRHTFSPGDSPFVPDPHALAYQQFTPGGPLVDVTVLNHTWGGAAGDLISTTDDLTRFWLALARGQLLRPAQLAEMQSTVLAETFQDFWPGARYGLGIMWRPLSCGGGYWNHGGDTLGYSTRNGVSSDGRRAVAISLSAQLVGTLEPEEAASRAVDNALCGQASRRGTPRSSVRPARSQPKAARQQATIRQSGRRRLQTGTWGATARPHGGGAQRLR